MSEALRLRALLIRTSAPLVVRGGGARAEALAIGRVGFQVFSLSGYAVAASRHGLPDIRSVSMRIPATAT